MAVSAGSLFQAFLAAYIMRQLSDPGYFNTLRDVVIFLFPAGLLASMIASIHNLAFFLELMRQAREKIIDGTFREWKEKMVKQTEQRL